MNPVNITPQYVTHYSRYMPDGLYSTGRFDVDIYQGKYTGQNLTFEELKDFVSFFVSDEHYYQIFKEEHE